MDLLGLGVLEMPAISYCSVAVVDESWHAQDGQILTSPRWRLMLQGVGERQWSPAAKSPVDVAFKMALRVG